MSVADEIRELERRYDDLVLATAELTRQNQARRAEVLLTAPRRHWPLVLTTIVVFTLALVAAGHWFPSTHHIVETCR